MGRTELEAVGLAPPPESVHAFHEVLKRLESVCKRHESMGSVATVLWAKKNKRELGWLAQELTQCASLLNLEVVIGMNSAQKDPRLVDNQVDQLWTRMKQLSEAESKRTGREFGSCAQAWLNTRQGSVRVGEVGARVGGQRGG